VFWLDKTRLGMFIGDVAGKGVAAALLMARISSDLRVAALAEEMPLKVLERVNQAMLEREQHDIFVTGVYLTLDIASRTGMLANAGHLPAFIRRAAEGVVEQIGEGLGTAIGFFRDVRYGQVEFQLGKGDTLVLCTDGILEAADADGELFGTERFRACLARGFSRPSEVAARLRADVRAHVGDAPQSDDQTLMICGVEEDSVPV